MSNIIPMQFEDRLIPFTDDGWINATHAAKHYGKRVQHWLDNEKTQEYLEETVNELADDGVPEFKSRNPGLLYRVVKGRNGGTWIHPELAVEFARWLSAKFARACDRHIKRLIEQAATFRRHENLLSAYILPDASDWELRFGEDYYRALARVTNTRYLGHSHGTPAIYGKITRRWVYEAIMPDEVLAEIDARKKSAHKLHQWLTDGGSVLLANQINTITLLANTSSSFRDFEARCHQMADGKGQLALVYPAAA